LKISLKTIKNNITILLNLTKWFKSQKRNNFLELIDNFIKTVIIELGSRSAGERFPLPKGGGAMSEYEFLSLLIDFSMLMVTIYIGTKK